MVAGELKAQYKRYISLENLETLDCSKLVYEFAQRIPEIKEDIEYKEFFYIFMFNNAAKLVGFSKIAEGGLTATTVDIRVILQHTLLSCATSLIIVHNHPSGKLKPSDNDIALTRQIKNALTVCNLSLLDHLIITANGYYSFADEGII